MCFNASSFPFAGLSLESTLNSFAIVDGLDSQSQQSKITSTFSGVANRMQPEATADRVLSSSEHNNSRIQLQLLTITFLTLIWTSSNVCLQVFQAMTRIHNLQTQIVS